MISIGQHLEREEIFYSGAEADARALLNEIKQALTIPAVVGRSEQYCDWCSSPKDVEVKICKRCRKGMDQHR